MKHIHRETNSLVQVRGTSARDRYHRVSQGQYESLSSYKSRSDSAYETYVELASADLVDEDVAMDILYSLDPNRYKAFVSDIVNHILAGALERPGDLNTVCAWADSRMETSQHRSGQVSFMTMNRRSHQRWKNKEENVECYNCGRVGHYDRNCTHDADGENEVQYTVM